MVTGSLGLVMTSPGQTYSISLFIEHFIRDLDLSRSLVSTLYTIATLAGSFALPFVGRQIDRYGSRAITAVVALLLGVSCFYMGLVMNAVMLATGFVALRMLGQGSLVLVSNNAINQWWVKRRGTMIGISGIFMALLGLGGFPILINFLLPDYGWRWTFVILGVIVMAVMVPLAVIFLRNRPEDFGLEPDGGNVAERTASLLGTPDIGVAGEENWPLHEAIRTSAFWILVSGISLVAMMHTGLFFHMVSIFRDNGLDAAVAAQVYVPIALATALMNLSSGILVDRFPLKFLLSGMLVFQAIVLFMAHFLDTAFLAILYGILLGATGGLMRTVNNVGWARYFGRLHLGSITGVTSTILIAGSALGPMPLGIARDVLGSYHHTLTLFALFPLLLAVASLFIRPPRRNLKGSEHQRQSPFRKLVVGVRQFLSF